jgi:predicted DNA-binding transcriptional regulator YafY
MKIASRPPLRRLLALDKMIRAGHYPNASKAARALEVNPRTVHRDLEFLRDSWGAPLAFSHRHNGYYYETNDYAIPLLRITEGELVALFLAERQMQQYRGTPFGRQLATAFHKLTAALPDPITLDLSHLGDLYCFRHQASDAGDARSFARLAKAVMEGRQLELVYWTASRDEITRRLVDPYHLASIGGDWYLIAYCHLREAIRMFAPGRIRSVRETGVRFERPADFRITEYLDASFRTMRGSGPPRRVRLRFTPQAARYIRERIWHPTQRLQEHKDGSLVLSMKVSHLLEVQRWVLSQGAGCVVLEPEELRRAVRRELEQMLELYGTMMEPFPDFPEDFAE